MAYIERMESKQARRESIPVPAHCGHTVKVRDTGDPDLNLVCVAEAEYLMCKACCIKSQKAKGLI